MENKQIKEIQDCKEEEFKIDLKILSWGEKNQSCSYRNC